MRVKHFFLITIFIICLPTFGEQFITIGTGSITGIYYPTGGAICILVNKIRKITGIRCAVESTDGSVYNINAVKNGELDFGICQSDVIYQAYTGTKEFKNTPIKEIRAIMSIYPELLTLVVRKDANIKNLLDIKNKKINIGNDGSGTEATVLMLFKEIGLDKKFLSSALQIKADKVADALKDAKLDGYFFMVGHPAANIKDASNLSDTDIISIDEDIIEKLTKKYPYYTRGVIPTGLYRGLSHDAISFGVKATLVTSSKTKDDIVYMITKSIMENFDTFKKLHPAYKTITKKSLLEGLSAPLHPGAKRYYIECGLLNGVKQ